MLDKTQKTREYLDYLEKHYLLVQEAWIYVKNKCHDIPFMQDKLLVARITKLIKKHDASKLSREVRSD